MKRAGQKIYLGSEEREGELESLPRSLLWLPEVGGRTEKRQALVTPSQHQSPGPCFKGR